MTIQHWQLVAVVVSAVLCIAALTKNKVILGKVAIALGLLAVAILQLTETPLDRTIRMYEMRLAGMQKNTPGYPQTKLMLERAGDRKTALKQEITPLEARIERLEAELNALPEEDPARDGIRRQLAAANERMETVGDNLNWIDSLPVKPGLDLQGGTEVMLRLRPDNREIERLQAELQALQAKLAAAPEGEKAAIQAEIKTAEKSLEDEQGILENDTAKAVDVIRERINSSGLSEIPVTRQGQNRVLVQLPGASEAETERVIETLQRQGRLEFRLVVDRDDDAQFYNRVEAENDTAGNLLGISRDTYKPLPEARIDADGRDSVTGAMLYDYLHMDSYGSEEHGRGLLVAREVLLSGQRVKAARAEPDPESGGWSVTLYLNTVGSELFRRITTNNVNRRLAIVLDGRLRSAPNITEPISGGVARITGGFDRDEADQLGVVLKSGSLRVKIERESSSFVGPTLGGDSIRSGVKAMVIGLSAVVLFMLAYYLIAGAVTDVVLLLNLVLIVAALSAWNATLTLPGIAGLILTVGMAVDANVLIFERIREEREKGNSLARSIALGYERAFVTIVDANVTTIITALILHSFGTEAVRGFALTLFLGIVTSMFCSLVLTRWCFELLVEYKVIKDLKMNRLFARPNFDFISIRRPAMVFSSLLIVAGLVVFGLRGTRNYGIDFTGGTLAHIQLTEPISTEAARERVAQQLASFPDAVANLQSFGEASADGSYTEFTLRTQYVHPEQTDAMSEADSHLKPASLFKDEIAAAFPELDAQKPFVRFESIGGVVADEMKTKALLALIYSMVAIFFYIWLRFQFRASFGIGAVVALLHDVLFTMGALAIADQLKLLNGQIDLRIVAALLTIVGYSLNDTIVVFDRVRENMNAGGKSLKEIINDSLSQTISRTVITSLTTLLVVLCLLILGGDVIRGFAFALFIGVLVGTYSSIFIASPILVELAALDQVRARRKREAAAATS